MKAPKGNAGAGTSAYKIISDVDEDGAGWFFFIDNAEQARRGPSDLATCWGNRGVIGAEWQNEMLNPGDQNGGTQKNRQLFEVRFRTVTQWRRPNFGVGDQCGANSNPDDWGCKIANADGSQSSNQWRSWDRNEP